MTWYAKTTGGYSKTSTEGQANAAELTQALYALGWCPEAIAAMLGNGAGESGLNPWRWEGDAVQPTNGNLSIGYGIFQFTPASKYINNTTATQYRKYGYAPNFSNRAGQPSDGAAQTRWFGDHVGNDFKYELYGYYADDFAGIGVDISTFYYTTYDNFINGTDNNGNPLTLAQLVGVFELCYERPADWAAASSYWSRVSEAQWWYEHLPEPEPPGPDPEDFPYWILFKFRGRGLRS